MKKVGYKQLFFVAFAFLKLMNENCIMKHTWPNIGLQRSGFYVFWGCNECKRFIKKCSNDHFLKIIYSLEFSANNFSKNKNKTQTILTSK